MKIACHKVSGGRASGPALVSHEPISFLGCVDPISGRIVDPAHPLFGRSIAKTVLIFPGGKGSTVGSYVIYQLKKRDAAPAAMINIKTEPIVAVGAIISDIPLVDGLPREILDLEDGVDVEVDSEDGIVVINK